MDEITFLMNGERMRLSREQVIDRMRSARPEPVQTWAVDIEGRLFPVKQVLAEATGANRGDFISHRARDLLQRLDFSVQQLDRGASTEVAHSLGEPGTRLAALRAAIDFYRDKPTATSDEVVEAARAYEAFLTERRDSQTDPTGNPDRLA